VEGAELNVLNSIDDNDWSLIKQISMEVHDIDHRIDKIQTLLSDHHFIVHVVSSSSSMVGIGVDGNYHIYATRQQR
jgi:hypothetical protein